MTIIPEIKLKDVSRRACLQRPRVTTTPKIIQKPDSMRLPVLSTSSKSSPSVIGGLFLVCQGLAPRRVSCYQAIALDWKSILEPETHDRR